MRARTLRRAAERQAAKLAAKTGTVDQNPTIVPAPVPEIVPEPVIEYIPTQRTPAQQEASRANGNLSHGPTSQAGLEISSQNRTVHGLTRINGNFRLLSSEDPVAFEAYKQSLADEHQPSSPTESTLINGMAEAQWLANRAESLQHTCIDPDTGAITDEKKASLYLRYQTTHTRAYHKCLNDLLKLRSERRKAALGFESQQIQKEKHEMKQRAEEIGIFIREVDFQLAIGKLITEKIRARREFPEFEAEFAAEVAKQAA